MAKPRRKAVITKYRNWQGVKEGAKAAMERTIRAAAFACEAEAKKNIRNIDAIDTGNLVNSVYVAIGHDDRRPVRLARAGQVFSKKQGRIIQVDEDNLAYPLPRPDPAKFEALVAVAAAYGEHVEYGTVRMAARPYMAPAAKTVRKKLRETARRILRDEFKKRLHPSETRRSK